MAFPPNKMQKSQSATGISELSLNSKLTGSRKEKLLNLKKREELKDVLVGKFKAKYGKGGDEKDADARSVTSADIHGEVDHFISNAGVSANNIKRLERRLQKKAGKKDDEMSAVSEYSLAPSVAGSNLSRGSRMARSRSASAIAPAQPTLEQIKEMKEMDWSKLDEYAAYLHEQDALRQKAGVLAMQQKLRLDLDRQVAEQRTKKQRQREEESKYFMNQLVEVEQWKEMERAKAEELKVKAHKEKRDRDEQLQYERMLKQEEVDRKKEEEAALVEKIAREMEMEKERMELRRQQQKAAMKKVFQENLEENAVKAEQKQKQADLDLQAMKEYNRILDQQEEMRAQELQARMDKQKSLMEKMKENVQKQQAKKGDEDSRRAAKQKEEADARAIEMERNKEAKLKEMRHDTQKFLFKQMAEKDEKKEQALELKRLQASILEADTQEYMQMEKQKSTDRRVRNIEHRIELEAQIADRAGVVNRKYAMSGAEVKMNRQLLDLVDKTLTERDQYMESHAEEE
jgi:hypothetical protein